MSTFARQHEALQISKEQALEGFFYFSRVRGERADKYPDYVEARMDALTTLQQLAKMERAFGTEKVRSWLSGSARKAMAQLGEGEAA